MPENKEEIEVKEYNNCCCECCHCKRIFMHAVIILLVFIAGIMVGNCRPCYYPSNYYDAMQPQKHHNQAKQHKMHRGMHQIKPTPAQPISSNTPQQIMSPTQSGDFIIEVDPGY